MKALDSAVQLLAEDDSDDIAWAMLNAWLGLELPPSLPEGPTTEFEPGFGCAEGVKLIVPSGIGAFG
jgi:hypothetical protein